VLDFGDVVVHVMSEEMRSYYDMESFYGAAEEVGCVCLQVIILCKKHASMNIVGVFEVSVPCFC